MKMRVRSKRLPRLVCTPACLNPFGDGRPDDDRWAHWLMRYAISSSVIGLLVSIVSLASMPFYSLVLSMQLAFYAMSAVGLLLESRRIRSPLAAISSFCLVNLAALCGTLHCCTLQPAGRWKPVR